MPVNRHRLTKIFTDYLFHRITLSELVNWAEISMMEADFDDNDHETLRNIISYLGLADVKSFGISWTNGARHLTF